MVTGFRFGVKMCVCYVQIKPLSCPIFFLEEIKCFCVLNLNVLKSFKALDLGSQTVALDKSRTLTMCGEALGCMQPTRVVECLPPSHSMTGEKQQLSR